MAKFVVNFDVLAVHFPLVLDVYVTGIVRIYACYQSYVVVLLLEVEVEAEHDRKQQQQHNQNGDGPGGSRALRGSLYGELD